MTIATEIERILAEDGRTVTTGLVAQLVSLFESYGVESAKQKDAEGWRSMDSAPRDGSSFLAIVWGRVRAIKWCAAWEVWFNDGEDTDTVDYERDEVFGIGSMLPTAWRPLPEPPSALLSAGGEG